MQRRLSNLFRRDQVNRNDPPRAPRAPRAPTAPIAPIDPQGAVAGENQLARDGRAIAAPAAAAVAAQRGHAAQDAYAARRRIIAEGEPAALAAVVAPEPPAEPPEPFDLALQDLRMHRSETDHNLVFAYPIPSGVYEPVALAVDSGGAGLEGRTYLQFLLEDPRTEGGMGCLIRDKLLSLRYGLSEERLNDIATRLRAVMAESYLSDDLMGEIEVLAVEALPHCQDRADVALGHMEDAALHARLVRGGVTDETTLYNYGVSYYMLNAVTEETRRLLAERRAAGEIPHQEVHDLQNALFHLQETLHLPHRLQQPIVPRARGGIVTQQLAEEVILPRVTARAIEHNGQNVMQYISTWAPWKNHLAKNWPAMQEMTASFHEIVSTTMEQRDVPGSRLNRMNEVEYEAKIKQVEIDRVRVETELANQLALELLFNRRGEYLVNHNKLSSYFG